MINYFTNFWRNLKGAYMIMKVNFALDPLKWFYYELNPSWYVKYDGWLSFKKEVTGWLLYYMKWGFPVPGHVPMGFLLCMVGFPLWVPFAYGFVIEIIQLFKANGEFINPGNSLLDILFYGAGGLLYHWIANSGLIGKLF